jgi:cytoskeletal protein CcmA (bactofilin family)
MFGRKKPNPESAAATPAPPEKTAAPNKAAEDDVPPMPSHLRSVGKPVLPSNSPSNSGTNTMSESQTPTFRPEIAKRPGVDLPKAVVQGTASAMPPSSASGKSDHTADPKVLLIGREISLNGQITACDKVIVEGKVEAQLTDSRFVEVSESGQFKGSAEVEEAEIRGRFEGRLSVRGRLLIRGSGKVSGEIAYGQIEIECGGEISGTVQTVAAGSRSSSTSAAAE